MEFVIVHKEPIVDRIPNLKSFILHAAGEGHRVLLVTTRSAKYPEPSFLSEKIRYIAIPERTKRIQLPTMIRFWALCLRILIARLFSNYRLILAGQGALAFGSLTGWIRLKKYFAFIIEYPSVPGEPPEHLSTLERLENEGIRRSRCLITHDSFHAEFIAEKLGIKDLRYVTIPNATPGEARIERSHFLHRRAGLPEDRKILLHSGGFGPWFDSRSLAGKSGELPDEYVMLFHISHDISSDPYYQDYLRERTPQDKSKFSLSPVSTAELDSLVSSAHIGIAWYSAAVLGYRAENLGLAAGKIGNYLKCGIPVIAPEFKSLSYITHYSCGILIPDLNRLADAIREIDRNYKYYADSAIRCFNELWSVEQHCDKALQGILQGI